MTSTSNPFLDFDEFNKVPRINSLALSPDGRRLITVVSELTADGKKRKGSLWEIDPEGNRPARRLTRSAESESNPTFTRDGSLLFISKRINKENKDAPEVASLWLLPGTGEARQVYAPPGGVSSAKVAENSDTVVMATSAFPGFEVGASDKERRKAREDAGVTAILHESYPIRYWDHDLGPDHLRLVGASLSADNDSPVTEVTELTQDQSGRVTSAYALSKDGQFIAYVQQVEVSDDCNPDEFNIVSILRLVKSDGSGDQVLASATDFSFENPIFTPDSASVLCQKSKEPNKEEAPNYTLVRIQLDGGEITDLTPNFPHWPEGYVVAPDGSAVFFVGNERGHCPVWRLDLVSGEITRLTATGAYSNLCVSPDSSTVYALWAAIDHPAHPVRIDAHQADQDPKRLQAPGAIASLPGTLTEIETTAADGRTVRAWLVLPESASSENPAPLLLWVHGGPLASWNTWNWRWCPWTAAARGYAVLLPDPALSTGYGQEFIQAGWGQWGSVPYTDLMTITDVAVARPDIDAERTAALGGSFGGYMANWIATQTNHFKAIVTHASLWNLDAFAGTTDVAHYWIREIRDSVRDNERILANSPHLQVANIVTPMLVIHGNKDYRVPIGESTRLYFDLVRYGVPSKFLYFPTESHWILSPGNAKIWYETVFAFLAEHVLDEAWKRPELL